MSKGNDRLFFSLPKTGSDWAIHKSKSRGKYYYYNIITGKSYWKRPKELTDDDLREISFPEGCVIPEEVNAESTSVTKRQPEKSKKTDNAETTSATKEQPGNSEKTDKAKSTCATKGQPGNSKKTDNAKSTCATKGQPGNSKKTDNSLAKVQKTLKKCGKNTKKDTANISKHRKENTVKQCKTARQRRNARKKIKKRLLKEPELPDYTDSDEDEPVAAKKAKTHDDGAKECQSENSQEKGVDDGRSVSDTSRIDSRELISAVATQQPETNDEMEEMDWSPDPPNNNIEVETEINGTEWSNLENEVTPMDIDIASPKDTCLVIDTNILIHDMKLVESITKSDLADGSKIIVVIPWQVLKELDGLKKSSQVGNECTTAIKFLHRCFSDKSSNVVAQNAISEKLGRHLIEIEVPDDNIIACCLQIIVLDRRTVLLTNDINLCNKAMAHNIEAYTREEFLKESSSLVLSTKKFYPVDYFSQLVKAKVFGDPPPPPIENVPYSVKKNLLARNYRKYPTAITQEKMVLANPPADTRHKTKETGVDSDSGPPPLKITRTVFNPSAIPLISLPNNEVSCDENPSMQAPAEKPPLPQSVLRNMLPRKKPKSQSQKGGESTQVAIASSSSGPPEKASGNLTRKRLTASNTIPNPALKSPSCNVSNRAHDLCQVRPSFQVQETSSVLINHLPELSKYVKLTSTDYVSKSWDKFMKFKFVVAEFIFSILKKGMSELSKGYGQWTVKIILRPPWTVQQLCCCLRTHWLQLTGHFPSPQILERLQCLEESISDIDNENLILENLNMAINICFSITPPLKNNFKDLVEIFKSRLNSLLSKPVGREEASHQYGSCLTEDVDSSRCLDLLSKILNKSIKLLALIQEIFDDCFTKDGTFDHSSPWIHQLLNLSTELRKKIRPTTLIIYGLKAIIQYQKHGFNVPQEPIDKLTLSLMEESEYSDPFFSKDDVIGLASEPDKWGSVLEFKKKYEEVLEKIEDTLSRVEPIEF